MGRRRLLTRCAVAAAVIVAAGGVKMEYLAFLTENSLDCPKAEAGDGRWRFTAKGDDVRPPQLGELYYLACEDGRRVGVAYVQPRVNAEDPASSSYLVTISDEDTRLAYDKRPCSRTFVYESSDPEQCLVEVAIKGTGLHLRRLLYTLPFGIGDGIRRSCISLDSEASLLQDALELLILSVFLGMLWVASWVSRAPHWATCEGEAAADSYAPGTYRAGSALQVTTFPGGGSRVGEVAAGEDVVITEVEHVGAGPVFGRISYPAQGWVQLRSSLSQDADLRRSFVLGAGPPGVKVVDWTQLFGELLLMAVGFAFTFTSLVMQLLKIVPKYSQWRLTVWITMSYTLLFGVLAVFCVWSKGCRHIAYQISLRQGKLFQPAVSTLDAVAFRVSCVGYVALAATVFLVVQFARARGDLSGSLMVLEYWAFFSLLVFNALCFLYFHWKEAQAKDGTCIVSLASKVEEQGSSQEVNCSLSFTLRLVQEEGLVAAGRSGSENLMQVMDEKQAQKSHGFSALDVPWFNSFVTRHVEPDGEWNKQVARVWPPLIVVLLAYQTSLLLGVCIQRQTSHPALLGLSELTGSLYPAFDPSHTDLSLFVDKDAASVSLYALANPAETTSLRLAVPGHEASSTKGNLLTRHAVEPGTYPPVLNYEVAFGPDTSRYTLHVQPVFLVVRSLTVHGRVCEAKGTCTEFTRCVPWGWARSGAITVPESMQDVRMEIAVAEHMMGVPVSKGYPGRPYTTYQASLSEEQCQTACRGDRTCVSYKTSQKGCFLVHADEQSACHPLGPSPRGDYGNDRSSLQVHAPAAQVCKTKRTDGVTDACLPMAWEIDSQTFSLSLPKGSLDWVDHETDLLLGLDSMMGGNPTSEHIRLRSGKPELNFLLASAEGAAVRVVRSSEPALTVELHEYDAQQVGQALELYLAAIPSDAAFQVKWTAGEQGTEPVVQEPPKPFAECAGNAQASRYQVCGGKVQSSSVMIRLDPWKPFGHYTLELLPEGRDGTKLFQPMSIPVRITTQADVKPIQWLARSCALPPFNATAAAAGDCADYPCGYPREVVEDVAQNCFSDRTLEIVEAYLTYPQHRGLPAAGVLVKLGLNKEYAKIREKWFADGVDKMRGLLPQSLTLRDFQLAAAEHKAENSEALRPLEEDLLRHLAEEDKLTFVNELASVVNPETYTFAAPAVFKQLGSTGLWDLVRAAAVEAKSEGAVRALAAWVGSTAVPDLSWVLVDDRLSPLALDELAVAVELFPTLAAAEHVSLFNAGLDAMSPEDCSDKLMGFLGKFTSLTALTLEYSGLSSPACIQKMGAERWAKVGAKLTLLKLGHNDMTGEGAQALAKYLAAMPKLEAVDISDNKLDAQSVKAIEDIAVGRDPPVMITK